MNKQQYLSELYKALKKMNIADIDDIMEEYEQHFSNKTADGYSQEEITAKLGDPQSIAEQFVENSHGSKQASKPFLTAGFVCLDIISAAVFIMLYGWVIVLGTFSLLSVIIGADLLANLHLIALVPQMPYIGALFFGISLTGLAFLSFAGTVYSHLYIMQWARSYKRFRKNTLNDMHYPSLSLTPNLDSNKKRRLRMLMIISLTVFGTAFIFGYIALASYTGSLGFWHVLGWFV